MWGHRVENIRLLLKLRIYCWDELALILVELLPAVLWLWLWLWCLVLASGVMLRTERRRRGRRWWTVRRHLGDATLVFKRGGPVLRRLGRIFMGLLLLSLLWVLLVIESDGTIIRLVRFHSATSSDSDSRSSLTRLPSSFLLPYYSRYTLLPVPYLSISQILCLTVSLTPPAARTQDRRLACAKPV